MNENQRSSSRWVGLLERRALRIALVAIVLALLGVSYAFQVLPPVADALCDYFLALACATTVTPIPTWPPLLYAATQAPAIWVALVGALASSIAYLLEYFILSHALVLGRVEKMRRSRVYLWLAGVFASAPFAALTMAAFLPLPVDGVRLMAIAERYHRGWYAAAAFIGRGARYYLVAALGTQLELSLRVVLVLIGVFALFAGLARFRAGRRQPALLLVAGLVASGAAGRPLAGEVADHPGPPPSVELLQTLDRFDAAVAGLTDARALFTQERYSPIFDDTEVAKGELAYRAGGELALQYREPQEQEVYIDAEGVWIYLVQEKQAQRYPFAGPHERDASLAVLWQPAAVLAERYRIDFPETPPDGEESGTWLQLTPRAADLAQVVTALYLRIGAEDLSDCLVVERQTGERVRLEVRELTLNQGVSDEQVRFEPPAGVDVVR